MSDKSNHFDRTPFLKQTGKTFSNNGENVDQCLRQDLYFTVKFV